jgi:hypothetical protein
MLLLVESSLLMIMAIVREKSLLMNSYKEGITAYLHYVDYSCRCFMKAV